MTYQYIDEQLGFPHQTSGHRAKQPLPRREIAAARKQALAESRQRRAAPATRPQPTIYNNIADDLDASGDEWEQASVPAITKRYDVGTDGVPLRRSRVDYYHDTPYQPPVHQAAPKPRRQFKIHWLVYVGIFLMAMLIGYILLTDLGAWWQGHQDDSAYGNPRTFQIDAVVGHGDSSSNPSHFIAENLRGQIVVEEIPGGDFSKARFYPITTEIGNAGNPPVVISFQDFDNDGKLDMIVKIGDPPNVVTYFLLNNGTTFFSKHG